MADDNGKAKKLKMPTLADAGKTLGAADVVLESLPDANKSSVDPSSASSLAFGACHLPPRLVSDTFPTGPMPGKQVADLLKGYLALDSRPSLNLASFVCTTIEPEARELMADSMTINYIDEEEYPSTAQIQSSCVSMIGDLLFAEKSVPADGGPARYTGTSTVGSSEAILLSYLAMKRRWQERRRAAGLPVDGVKCSVVVPSSYHVCHEKAANYFEIEMRVAPLKPDRLYSTAEDLLPLVDETTIGVVAILGSTYSGDLDRVAEISDALEKYNAQHPGPTPVGCHVDGASGGFVSAFLFPELKADFRSKSVVSINLSGHKTGQVCAGIGWAMFRSREYLPESLVFHDSYLGNDQISFTLNFSKGASQILGQSYMFLRLGKQGYQQVLGDCWRVSAALADMISSTGAFEIVSPRAPTPGIALVAFRLDASHRNRGYDEHDLSDGLRERGWIVPAYPLPVGTEADGAAPLVLRIVCRADLSFGLAQTLAADIARALDRLEQREAKDREEALAARTTQSWRSAKNKAKAKRRHEAAKAAREAAELRAALEAKQAAAKEKEKEGGGKAAPSKSTADLAARAEEKGAEAAAAAAAVGAEGGLRHGGVC